MWCKRVRQNGSKVSGNLSGRGDGKKLVEGFNGLASAFGRLSQQNKKKKKLVEEF